MVVEKVIQAAFNHQAGIFFGLLVAGGAAYEIFFRNKKKTRHFPTTPEELDPTSPTYALDKKFLERRMAESTLN